ncbi:MAG: triple tyrosine motif-containing protein [Bacteroidales bacterium]|nr:triple tyrosine motif-containing protein [Bacteroidales bacterium]
MKKLKIYLLLILLSINVSGWAQQLYFNHLSVNNGLSQGVNNCIYRDSKGFVWISSFDGLNRFDGLNCINFRSTVNVNEKNGLTGTLFLNILEDKNSNLWIGSNAGLNLYNRKLDRFQNFRIANSRNDERFYSPFYIDDKNNVWLQSGSSIYIFNPANKTFTFLDNFFSPGNLIVKPWSAGLFQPLQKIFVIYNNLPILWEGQILGEKINWQETKLSVPSTRIITLLQTANTDFWFGTNTGLYLYKKNKQRYCINHFADLEIKNVSTLHLDQNGTLWAGTNQQGIFTIDTASGTVKNQYSHSVYNSYALAGNQIQYIVSDNRGDLWVSVWGKGVDFTSLNRFRFNQNVTKEEADHVGSDNFMRSIIQLNNEFWCATQSSGILVLDENKKIKRSIRAGLPLSIEHLSVDKNNNVWASTFEGLFLMDPITKKGTKLPFNNNGFSPGSDQYNYISSLPNGSMLASTNAGLFIIARINNKYQIRPAKGMFKGKDVFLTTYVDRLNQIYISRAFKGFTVCKFEGDSLVVLKEFPLEATIKCFNESSDSNLWIGSTIGMIRFDKYKLKSEHLYTTADGLSNQYIYGIVSDGRNLWLSTNAGINCFDIRNNAVKTFSAGDGLQSNEYNTYSCYKTNKGEILFGGVNGLNSFYPADFKNNSYPPQLILTGLQINDTTFKPRINPSEIEDLSLEYEQNTVSFQFTVIHFANVDGNTLSYILEGYDKSWIHIASKAQIRFANLPPGHYTLKVRAFNADGIEALKIYSLPLTIEAPWWQSWWFRLLALFILAGLIILVVRNYTNRRLEKQRSELEKTQAIEKERNRISRDMHDDLGSGLTIIAILSEVVKKQLSNPVKAKETLDKIAVSSRDLVDNLQDIIWVLNPQNDTVESLSSYIREYGLKYFEPLSVQLEFDYPELFSNRHLSEEQRRNIFLTVKESFNNIAKYAWCNKVIVEIEETSTGILLSIKDDGKGFDVNKVRLFANGLKNMQHRIEQVGGSYSISSEPGNGTLTEIKI